jgi:hypothetical protein
MTNNEIAAFFRAQMLAMLAEQDHPEVDVTSSFQPNNQGRLDGPVLYFVEIGDVPHGAQRNSQQTDIGTGQTTVTSAQRMRISYQVQGFAPADVTDLTVLRAADVVKLALMLMASPPFIAALKANGMGIEKIPSTKPNFVVNDRAQFEAGPTFEFTISYQRSIIQKSAIIQTAEFATHRV